MTPSNVPPPQFPRVNVVASPSPESWTAHVHTAEGTRVALHSTRAPRIEAQRQLDTIVSPPSVIALIGAGLGFVTEAAHERWPDARIVALEPSAALADQARLRTPGLYESARVRLLSGPDYASDEPLWQLLDQKRGPEPAVLVHPVIARLAPDAASAAEACARRAILAAQMNARARRDNAARYLLNTLRNLPVAARGVDITALHGQFAGIPIVIVAAGPSLDAQLEALRAIADRALIIAADTAWRPLAAAGIDPHIVVALDPTEMNGRHLLAVPGRRRPWLLAELSVDPRALQAFGGRVGAFRVGNHHPWPWAGTAGITAPIVRAWGSVITSATDLALSFGGNPIVFAGADLAFTSGQPYCRGTTFEQQWALFAARGGTLRQVWDRWMGTKQVLTMPDLRGTDTQTAPYLVEFRDWLTARAAEHRDRRFVNTTGAGILAGAHIEQAELGLIGAALPGRGLAPADILERHWTVSAASSHACVASLRAGLGALEQEAVAGRDGAVTSVLSAWLEFGEPKLTLADVRMALRDAVRALDEHTSASAPTTSPATVTINHPAASAPEPSRRHAADRVMRMRAWLADESEDREPTRVPRTPGIDFAVSRLLAIQTPLTTDEAAPLGNHIRAIPPSCRFAWAPDVMPMVASLEDALLDALDCEKTPAPAGTSADLTFWRRADLPIFGPHDDPGNVPAEDDRDAAVRGSLLTTIHQLTRAPRDYSRRECRLLAAVHEGLADPLRYRTSHTRYRLRWEGRVDIPLRIDALMTALTGTFVRLRGDGPPAAPIEYAFPLTVEPVTSDLALEVEPRLMFLRADATHVEPDVLTDRGLPPVKLCDTASASHATLVPGPGRQMLRIDANGVATSSTPWPDVVNGEVAWNEDGAIAWSHARCEILCRAAADAPAVRERVPFTPLEMAKGPNATYWLGASGGLWEWTPGRTARRIADAPANGWLELDGAHLLLHPFERDPATNLRVRRRSTYAWRYDIASAQKSRVDTGLAGQVARTCVREGWTARSHPFAGYVSFSHRDGRVLGLACHAPFGLAWAGGALLVTTLDADVLLFADMWSLLPVIC